MVEVSVHKLPLRVEPIRDGVRARLSRRVAVGVTVILLIVVVLVSVLYALARQSRPAALRSTPPTATATATATELPSSTPDAQRLAWIDALHAQAQQAYVDDLIAHMPLDEEIGQVLVSEFNGRTFSPDILAKIQRYHVSGLIFYLYNVVSADQLRTLTRQMQQAAKIPLLIAIDQEGGTVDRLRTADRPHPSAESLGADNDPAYTRRIGQEVGQFMASVGLNQNYAPVADVQNVPDSQTYMSTRMFGWTPNTVTPMTAAYLDGLQEGHHVVGTVKHFPGLGSIAADPHQTSIVLNRSLGDLDRIDWAPYRALIASGRIDIIMTTHITVTAVDPNNPTTVSYPVTTGILRNKLGFGGVIMTDDIGMVSLDQYSIGERVVRAFLAGNDLIESLYSEARLDLAFSAMHDALASGRISKQRLDESVRRIVLLKVRYGILPIPQA
jgi:beta-N-acetylhexosaminidase